MAVALHLAASAAAAQTESPFDLCADQGWDFGEELQPQFGQDSAAFEWGSYRFRLLNAQPRENGFVRYVKNLGNETWPVAEWQPATLESFTLGPGEVALICERSTAIPTWSEGNLLYWPGDDVEPRTVETRVQVGDSTRREPTVIERTVQATFEVRPAGVGRPRMALALSGRIVGVPDQRRTEYHVRNAGSAAVEVSFLTGQDPEGLTKTLLQPSQGTTWIEGSATNGSFRPPVRLRVSDANSGTAIATWRLPRPAR